MKFFYIFLLTLPLLGHSYPAAEEKSLSLEEVEDVDSEHAESESNIQKRSGSFDYVSHLKSGLLSSLGQASAGIAGGSSGGSSGGGGGYKSHDSGHHGNSVSYDPWSFKKSVLNTIFQAVKAITGGVTALKGQLIKGSGYALSASGNLVAASGDKVTDVGKAIINSAQLNSHSYGQGHSGGGGGGGSVHPFAKFSSLSGASSGGSSGGKHSPSPGPVVHTETITTYEIPSGHASYGPPSKPPTYSSATHQYLPPGGSGYSGGGGAPFSGGHVAFEAPPSNYLPSSGYGHDAHTGHDDFNIYGRHKKLTEDEARKAAVQLQEILGLLPNGKTEFTASKTVTLDTAPTGPGDININPEHVELHTYGLPNDLGPLESLSHTESITAAYGPRPTQSSSGDIYHQMAKKPSPEEVYIQKHPNEGYDYKQPANKPATNNGYKYNNYHATNNALQDLTPIIAALEVAKRRTPTQNGATNTQYSVERNVYKNPQQQTAPSQQYGLPQTGPAQQFAQQQQQHGGGQGPQGPSHTGQFNYQPPVVQKSKYTYFNPAQSKADSSYRLGPVYTGAYKVRRQAPAYGPPPPMTYISHKRRPSLFHPQDYEIHDPLMFNRALSL